MAILRRTVSLCRLFFALGLGCVAATPAYGDLPTAPEVRAKVLGQPAAITVQPDKITLSGPRATQQLVISGRYADGNLRDLTHFAEVAVEAGDIATLDTDRFLRPKKNGTTHLIVKAGAHVVKIPVTVTDLDKPQPVSFRNEVIASLNVGGCNHGRLSRHSLGQERLQAVSLRGYDPAADYSSSPATCSAGAPIGCDPEASLMLQKALGRVPHEGGRASP